MRVVKNGTFLLDQSNDFNIFSLSLLSVIVRPADKSEPQKTVSVPVSSFWAASSGKKRPPKQRRRQNRKFPHRSLLAGDETIHARHRKCPMSTQHQTRAGRTRSDNRRNPSAPQSRSVRPAPRRARVSNTGLIGVGEPFYAFVLEIWLPNEFRLHTVTSVRVPPWLS